MRGADKFSRFGVGQNVRREWLDAALACAAQGMPADESRVKLMEIVSRSTTKSGLRGRTSAEKVVGMLGAWFAPKKDMAHYVGQLLARAKVCSDAEIAALHWAVLSGTYPFFLEVTAMVGRLLDLQESALKSQLARRCEERFGASTTIARNLEYALWNLVELGILDHGGEKGAYKAGPKLEIEDEHTACLLWKGILHGTKTGRMDAVRLQSHPALFPFALPPMDTMALCARFDDIDWDATIGGEESVFLRHS